MDACIRKPHYSWCYWSLAFNLEGPS